MMELNHLLAGVLLVISGTVLGQQGQLQQGQQQPAEFRQLQEPVFTPPLPLNNNNLGGQIQPNFQQFQQRQQQFNNQQPQALPQQQQQQQQQFNQQPQQFNQQQRQQQQFNQPQQQQQQQQQNFNRDVTNFNQPGQGQETLPTLPPVFIPPNSPQGPPPQLQSPIRNLFRQPGGGGGDGFSLSNIINRFFNLFNLGNN